jgi:hypothetical protein
VTDYEHVMQLAEEFRIDVYFHDVKRVKGGWFTGACAWPSTRSNYRWTSAHTRYYDGAFTVHTAPRTGLCILVPRPWRSKDAYLTCLHEIGHCARKHVPSKYDTSAFKCELEAWDWAIDYSHYDLTLPMLDMMWRCLRVHPYGCDEKKLKKWYAEWRDYIKEAA